MVKKLSRYQVGSTVGPDFSVPKPYVPSYNQSADNTHLPVSYNQQQRYNTDHPQVVQEQAARLENWNEKQKVLKKKADHQVYANINKSNALNSSSSSAVGDKMRFIPSNSENFFDNYLNPFKMVGDMADGLAHTYGNPNSTIGDYALAAGIPLAAGAMAGMGAKSTGEFVNNLTNPLAGINLKEILNNTYKINPWAHRTNPESFYRTLGQSGYEDAVNTGMLRARPGGDGTLSTSGMNLSRPSDVPYFAKGEIANYPGNDIVAETAKPLYRRGDINPVSGNEIRSRHWGYRNIDEEGLAANLPVEDVKFLKKDWLQGYKEIPSIEKASPNWLDNHVKGSVGDNTNMYNQAEMPFKNRLKIFLDSQFTNPVRNSTPWGNKLANDGAEALKKQYSDIEFNRRLGNMYPTKPGELKPFESILLKDRAQDDIPIARKFFKDRSYDGSYQPTGYGATDEGILKINKGFRNSNPFYTTIHEGTHFMQNPRPGVDALTKDVKDRLLKPFGYTSEEHANKISEWLNTNGPIKSNGDLPRDLYITSPEEIHARMNEIRHAINPGNPWKEITSSDIKRMNNLRNLGLPGGEMMNHVKYEGHLKDLFNTMFTAGVPAFAAYNVMNPSTTKSQ